MSSQNRIPSRRRLPMPVWRLLALLLLACAGLAAPPLAAAQDWVYRVRPGDTLWQLRDLYLKPGVDWQRLGRHNAVADPYALPPGQPLRFPIAWLRVQPAPARVIALRGGASVLGIGSATAPVREGMLLPIGTTLQTEAEASVTVQFADGSQMQVRENSRVRFDQLARYGATGMVDTRVRLEQGRASNEVVPAQGPASRYIIQTPAGTSSVRGTRFRAAAGGDGQLAATEVLHGVVQVGNPHGRQVLHPGEASRMAADASPLQERLLPAPVLDEQRSRLDHAPYLLAWQPLPGAAGYRVEAVDAEQRQVLRFARQTAQAQIALDDLPTGRLLLLVRGIAATGVEGEDAERALQVWATPLPPLTLQPLQQQQLRTPHPRFEWTRSADATATVLQLARDAQFGELVFERTTDATRLRAPLPLPPGDYFWRVASRDAQGRQGPFGQPLQLQISDAPLDPSLQPPEAAKGQLTLRWQAGEPGQRYRVQIARKPDFAAPLLLDRTLDTPQISLPRPRGGTWYVRVQQVDDDGYAAPFSPTQVISLPCRGCYLGGGAGALLLWLLL
ncbi:FecR domain-containing protein [Xanthomonas sp. NCPPB 2654]|uniref:FecR domain-containing protein n=1 Tax=unclassified Xanthomonas TaxID=2643310 RepID=UPI0021E071F4|nr:MULTISPECIES: FecR domain-containing protein [unclassified Xanthomonas]MDL5364497.1 FecR domain-containing protein [Xanthomonas sp. NCPPB 2654]UYC22184.1 FecR domain-containing protein [Xanthomonas sp. CFBP 8443]